VVLLCGVVLCGVVQRGLVPQAMWAQLLAGLTGPALLDPMLREW
jgi:hypothetical protein